MNNSRNYNHDKTVITRDNKNKANNDQVNNENARFAR